MTVLMIVERPRGTKTNVTPRKNPTGCIEMDPPGGLTKVISRLLVLALVATSPLVTRGQAPKGRDSPSDVLALAQWRRLDAAVDRGLAWMALQQQPDGSFPTRGRTAPAITSLAAMAFLSRGHRPGVGPYGMTLDRAIDFVLSQQNECGLIHSDDCAATTRTPKEKSLTTIMRFQA